jgi:hypothetical protein
MTPALTVREVLVLLHTACTAHMGTMEMRVAHTSAPRLQVAHVGFRRLADVGIGKPEQTATTVRQARQLSVELRALGEDAEQVLTDLAALLWTQTPAMVALSDAGVAVQGVGTVTDVTGLTGPGFELRSVCAVQLGYIREITATGPGDADAVRLLAKSADVGMTTFIQVYPAAA